MGADSEVLEGFHVLVEGEALSFSGVLADVGADVGETTDVEDFVDAVSHVNGPDHQRIDMSVNHI